MDPTRIFAKWAIASAMLAVLLVAVAGVVSSSPVLCASCHEMSARSQSWGRSAHSEVSCVRCHQKPRPWHAFPQTLVDRGRLFARDISSHTAGYEGMVQSRSKGTAPIQDEVCLQCHDPGRKATSGFRILIDHKEHAKRNGSCVSCHVNTAHTPETRSNAMALMAQCFTCHGTGKDAKASGECGLCHPPGYQLLPVSHKKTRWKRSHGKVSQADERQCLMCHRRAFCDDCHGLEIPHPVGWAEGRTGHSRIARTNREVCSRCHEGGPDLCTMCHHEGYDEKVSSWTKQHPVEASRRGAAHCLECHSPLFCADCHVRGALAR